ncbi:MAG: hypothetical protein A2W00_08050 [Candidatus Eisenbacteria bacterium RBG_16_71_46]|nr:MAG: hypothetical protein A2W00_08050 [Candidatus Eisenbacteria bacterium RBG_16_71_46]OGF25932.1 MAG: hypothetical protein A2V63_01295 [Candidatus Eisenbacteria bacterium RBG_19FT_COMBO_70_11]
MSHEIPILRELLLLAATSLGIVLLFQRLRLPATIGFIVAGILIGPGGFRLVPDSEFVRTMADIGVVLLLFTVGLEFSLADLRRLGRTAIVGGGLQVLLTVSLVAAALMAIGQHPARALFFGMMVSLSSTAVVLKLLSDRVELEAPHGRLATAVLIFQDIVAIGFLLAIPMLGRWLRGGAPEPGAGIQSLLGVLALVAQVGLLFVGGQRVVSWLLDHASRSRSREAFLFGVLLVALGSAWLASLAGVSLALGAFLAGMMLAESDLREQIAADVLPFRDTLASVFFIAIGMSFYPRVVLSHPLLVLASTVGLVLVKLAAGQIGLRVAGAPWRVGFAAGLALAQIGEFSFLMAQVGEPLGLLGDVGGQAFFAGAVFSLVLTPLLVARAPEWALALELRFFEARARLGRHEGAPVRPGPEEHAPRSPLRSGHVVIAGFGLNGQNVARVLRATRLPHLVVDINPDALGQGAEEGSPVLLGDITRHYIQKQAGIARARVLVLALSDATATRQACRVARALSREVHIIVRTRYVSQIDELYRVGANQVIPEEFETSIEIFTAVLRDYHVPNNVIQVQIQLLREERYSLLRGHRLPGSVVEQLDAILERGTTETFLLLQHSPAVGRTLEDLGFAGAGRPKVVAVVRGGAAIAGFDRGERLRVGDTLVLTGTHAEIDRAFDELGPPREGSLL